MDSDGYAAWRDRLATANDPRLVPIEAIDALLNDGQAQFWHNDDAAMVTRLVYYPGGAVVVEAVAAVGTIKAIHALEPAAEAWARKVNATHLCVIGRPGWERASPPGWQHYQSIMIRPISKDAGDGR